MPMLYTYKGPLAHLTRPGGELLTLRGGTQYDLQEGELPGLMDHRRPESVGRLTPAPVAVEAGPAITPKPDRRSKVTTDPDKEAAV